MKSGHLNFLEPSGPIQACNGTELPFTWKNGDSGLIISSIYITFGGTRWRSSSRHCATSRKVAFSISDVTIGIFHWHNPSGYATALGLTQPLAEMSTRNISWGVHRADNLTAFMCRLSWNLGASTSWNPQDLSRPLMALLYLLLHLRSQTWQRLSRFKEFFCSCTWNYLIFV